MHPAIRIIVVSLAVCAVSGGECAGVFTAEKGMVIKARQDIPYAGASEWKYSPAYFERDTSAIYRIVFRSPDSEIDYAESAPVCQWSLGYARRFIRKRHILDSRWRKIGDASSNSLTLKLPNAGHYILSVTTQTESVPNATKEFHLVIGGEDHFTRFGVDAGGVWDSDVNGTAEERLEDIDRDHFRYIRHFVEEVNPGYWLAQFAAKLEPDMKLIPVFGWKAGDDEDDFADNVESTLESVNQYILDGTIPAVEIGNEVAAGNLLAGGFEDSHGSTAEGADYVRYYEAAHNRLRDTGEHPGWLDLEIVAASAVNVSFAYHWNEVTEGEKQNVFGSSKAFLRGFLGGLSSKTYAPDTIAIHNYNLDGGTWSPEYYNFLHNYDKPGSSIDGTPDYNTQRFDFFKRLRQLRDLVREVPGYDLYNPSFAQTEYGYSPSPEEIHGATKRVYDLAPGNTSEEAQAVYYLRSCLIAATSYAANADESAYNPARPFSPLSYKYCYYYHHPFDSGVKRVDGEVVMEGIAEIWEDFGFTKAGGVERKASKVARLLHAKGGPIDANLNFDSEYSEIWIPVHYVEYDGVTGDPGYAWCGWKTVIGSEERYWGAIWRYKEETSYSEISISETLPFKVRGNFIDGYEITTRMIDVSGTPPEMGTPAIFTPVMSGAGKNASLVNDAPGSQPLGELEYTVLDIPNVTHNPVFIQFKKTN